MLIPSRVSVKLLRDVEDLLPPHRLRRVVDRPGHPSPPSMNRPSVLTASGARPSRQIPAPPAASRPGLGLATGGEFPRARRPLHRCGNSEVGGGRLRQSVTLPTVHHHRRDEQRRASGRPSRVCLRWFVGGRRPVRIRHVAGARPAARFPSPRRTVCLPNPAPTESARHLGRLYPHSCV